MVCTIKGIKTAFPILLIRKFDPIALRNKKVIKFKSSIQFKMGLKCFESTFSDICF